MSSPSLNAAIAAHRFGLGEPRLQIVGTDPAGWLRAQIGPADPARGEMLLSSMQAMRAYATEKSPVARVLKEPEKMTGKPGMAGKTGKGNAAMQAANAMPDSVRDMVDADLESRLITAAATRRPFPERLTHFWANHFSVSVAKGPVRGLAGAMEREAIRPNVAGNFETLLRASALHPAMIRYLDNNRSAGPHSRMVERGAQKQAGMDDEAPKRRLSGLNENLAREILELHTLGVAGGGGSYGPWGGYTQADVTAFAAVLTGWRAVESTADSKPTTFEAGWHEPGPKRVLGKTYPEGPQALDMVLHDLARHPNTARHLATKLARHFVSDEPPKALVDRLARNFESTGGDLAAMYRTLIESNEAWDPAANKLKTPEEFAISTLRVLGQGDAVLELVRKRAVALGSMGQRPHYAPSPAGWPDQAEEWLGPDALWKRVEWAMRMAERLPPNAVDARALARESLGPRLSETTARQIERAADGQQAVVLLLLSPEFQRR